MTPDYQQRLAEIEAREAQYSDDVNATRSLSELLRVPTRHAIAAFEDRKWLLTQLRERDAEVERLKEVAVALWDTEDAIAMCEMALPGPSIEIQKRSFLKRRLELWKELLPVSPAADAGKEPT